MSECYFFFLNLYSFLFYISYFRALSSHLIYQWATQKKNPLPSKPDTSGGTSWFNLAVKDNVEVMTETKRALGGQVCIGQLFLASNIRDPQVPSPGLPLVCEISLKTAEGDSLVLELWRLAVIAGGDPSVKVA